MKDDTALTRDILRPERQQHTSHATKFSMYKLHKKTDTQKRETHHLRRRLPRGWPAAFTQFALTSSNRHHLFHVLASGFSTLPGSWPFLRAASSTRAPLPRPARPNRRHPVVVCHINTAWLMTFSMTRVRVDGVPTFFHIPQTCVWPS